VYATVEEKASRFKVWKDNRELIDLINESQSQWVAGMNQFGDLTNEEFRSKLLLPTFARSSLPQKDASPTFAAKLAKKREEVRKNRGGSYMEFDWRDWGAVTSVKDQGTVGTCWAFSTIGNIEGQHYLCGNDLVSLSPEYLVDCDGSADYDQKHADCGVFGGWPYLAYQFVLDQGGVPTEESYPYCSGTGDCFPCMQGPTSLCGPPPYYCDETIEEEKCPSADLSASIDDWFQLESGVDEDEMADVLSTQGPLSVLIDASQLQFYQSGVWDGQAFGGSLMQCSSEYLDHAVLAVGFGVEEAGGDGLAYWTVKNSWGERWGEDGFFRMEKGQNLCGVATAVTSAIKDC
jgi:cathepsin F